MFIYNKVFFKLIELNSQAQHFAHFDTAVQVDKLHCISFLLLPDSQRSMKDNTKDKFPQNPDPVKVTGASAVY